MDDRHQFFGESIVEDEKGLRLVQIGEKIDTSVGIGEAMDVGEEVWQPIEHVSILVVAIRSQTENDAVRRRKGESAAHDHDRVRSNDFVFFTFVFKSKKRRRLEGAELRI